MELKNEEYQALFIKLWHKIVDRERNGIEPPRRKRENKYTNFVFTDTKIDRVPLNDYLLQNPYNFGTTIERYFYRRYLQATVENKKTIEIDDEVLFNAFYYIGFRLKDDARPKDYSFDKVSTLLDEFKVVLLLESLKEDEKPNTDASEANEKPKNEEPKSALEKALADALGNNGKFQLENIRFEDDRPELKKNLLFSLNTYSNDKSRFLRKGDFFAPYVMIHDYRRNPIEGWGKYSFDGSFALDPIFKAEYDQVEANRKEELGKGNNRVVRVKDYIKTDNTFEIICENAEYYHQVCTNLILDKVKPVTDFPTNDKGINTFRKWDMYQAGSNKQLPPLSKSKLSNTIGVAVAIYTMNEQGQRVYIARKRSEKNVIIFKDTIHLAFSFALKFEKEEEIPASGTIKDLIRPCFEREQLGELGFIDKSFENVKPLAFCRELMRGGKPQFFLEMEMTQPFEEIKSKVKEDQLIPEYVPNSLSDNFKINDFNEEEIEMEKTLRFFTENKISSELFGSLFLVIDEERNS